jgi:hypothetical protein
MLYKIKKFIKLFKIEKPQHSLLIKEINQDESGAFVAVIQVIGKPVFFPRKLDELVKDEKLLIQFPPEQIKTLVTLACNEQNLVPSFKISAIDYEAAEFIVKETSTKKFFTLSLSEISEPYLIDNFSKADVFKIGMMYGEQKIRADHDQIRQLKQPKLNVVHMAL